MNNVAEKISFTLYLKLSFLVGGENLKTVPFDVSNVCVMGDEGSCKPLEANLHIALH